MEKTRHDGPGPQTYRRWGAGTGLSETQRTASPETQLLHYSTYTASQLEGAGIYRFASVIFASLSSSSISESGFPPFVVDG